MQLPKTGKKILIYEVAMDKFKFKVEKSEISHCEKLKTNRRHRIIPQCSIIETYPQGNTLNISV